MESIKTVVNSNKTATTLDLSEDLKGLTKDQKTELSKQIGELLVTKIIESCADEKSPVDGSSFQKLSKEYAAKKKAETGSSKANLDLNGDMFNSLDYKVSGDKIEIGVYGSDAGKADGHNNFSGKSKIPTRQFLPNKGESFDTGIMGLVQDTIDQYITDNATLNPKKLDDINSKSDLYDYLKDELGNMSDSRIKELVLSSELATQLDDFGLLDYL